MILGGTGPPETMVGQETHPAALFGLPKVSFRLSDQIIQTSGFHITFDLQIPRIVEINLCESL